jgi:oxalate decarboxylase/phosphoglucose isomerase-like protein (cupin superfamily)
MNLSTFTPATRWAFFEIPSGWEGDWPPTPRRQIFFWLAGEVEITVSDGEVRRFPAGTVLLVEDTTGRGHYSRTVAADTLAALVQFPD